MDRKELTKRHLAQALLELCDEGARLRELRVADVIGRAQVARQTFYNNFSCMGDLIYYTATLPMLCETAPFTDIEATRRVYETSAWHRSFFQQLAEQTGPESFYARITSWLRKTYRQRFIKPSLSQEERQYREACLDVYCYGCASAFMGWCASGMTAPVEPLVAALYDMTPDFAKPQRDNLPTHVRIAVDTTKV